MVALNAPFISSDMLCLIFIHFEYFQFYDFLIDRLVTKKSMLLDFHIFVNLLGLFLLFPISSIVVGENILYDLNLFNFTEVCFVG